MQRYKKGSIKDENNQLTNEEIVKRIKAGENLLEDLYVLNLGFVNYYAKCLSIPEAYYEDFIQQAYFALLDAVKAYPENSRVPFLKFYKRCLLHQYFLLKLEMFYPISFTRSVYEKLKDSHALGNITCSKYNDLSDTEKFSSLCEEFDDVEFCVLSDAFWNLVADNLSEVNYYVIWQRFVEERTYEDISEDLAIGGERVRRRVLRSLQNLKEIKEIQEIACDFFCLPVESGDD